MNARPRERTVPIGLLVAAIGAVLLIVSLFLDWYEADLEGFTVFEFLDLLLVLMALATIASLAGGLGLVRPAPSPPLSLAVALFTILVVLSQLLNDPPAVATSDAGKEIGIWLALGGAALMVAGSVLAAARISLAFEARSGPGPSGPAAGPAGTAGDAVDDEGTRSGSPYDESPEGAKEADPTRSLDDPDSPVAERPRN
jgi:hypothetical protein